MDPLQCGSVWFLEKYLISKECKKRFSYKWFYYLRTTTGLLVLICVFFVTISHGNPQQDLLAQIQD